MRSASAPEMVLSCLGADVGPAGRPCGEQHGHNVQSRFRATGTMVLSQYEVEREFVDIDSSVELDPRWVVRHTVTIMRS